LRDDLSRLQFQIDRLNLEKQELTQSNQEVISELHLEIGIMTKHLDHLSKVFEDVEGIDNAMGVMAIPGRFARFWQALKALIIWWREEQGYELGYAKKLSATTRDVEFDRLENPQMNTDPASIQRSLRDQ
jgi:hypothetical protein